MKKGFYLMMLVGFCSLIGCKDDFSFLPWTTERVVILDAQSNRFSYNDSLLNYIETQHNNAILAYTEVRDELIDMFHQIEGIQAGLNPTNTPGYYWTKEEADIMGRPELAGTPNFYIIEREWRKGIGLFTPDRREEYEIPEEKYVDFKKKLNMVTANVNMYAELREQATEGVYETWGMFLDKFSTKGYAVLMLSTMKAVDGYIEVRDELIDMFHQIESADANLNPTDAPSYYFTAEEADIMGRPELSGTPNFVKIEKEYRDGTGLFSSERRQYYTELTEDVYLDFKKKLNLVTSNVNVYAALRAEAVEAVTETVGIALDELANSNSYLLLPDAGINTSVGVVFYDNDRGQYYFQANPFTGGSREDYDEHQYAILSMNSEDGDKITDRKYFGDKDEAMMFLASDEGDVVFVNSGWSLSKIGLLGFLLYVVILLIRGGVKALLRLRKN